MDLEYQIVTIKDEGKKPKKFILISLWRWLFLVISVLVVGAVNLCDILFKHFG